VRAGLKGCRDQTKFELDGLPAARSAAERLDRRNGLGEPSDFSEAGDKGYRLVHLTPPVEIPRDW
jgi:hypothetical protein